MGISRQQKEIKITISVIAELDAQFIKKRPGRVVSRVVSHFLFQGRPATTRARWLNPLIFQVLRTGARTPQLRRVRRPIFIVGTGRSGTTVLGTVLSLHPQVGFLNEPKALWHEIYPYEDVIGSYSRGRAHYRLDASQVSDEIIERAHRVYGFYLWLTRSGRVVDKYPEMIFRIPFVRAIFPEARFVFIVRNGWDTTRSIDRWSDRAGENIGDELHDWWGIDSRKWHCLVDDIAAKHPTHANHVDDLHAIDRHIDRAALEWALTMDEGRKYLNSSDPLFHLVRYEELTRYPRETLTRLLAFADLSQDEAVLRYGEKTLAPVPARDKVFLNPLVAPLFKKMMREYRYE